MMTSNKLDLDIGHDLIDNGTSDDYYTPPYIFKALNLEFDLDVCAPPSGVPWIPAKRHYSLMDDGLSQKWTGTVWMNPPFSKVTPWIERFLTHRDGIALVQFSKSKWLDRLWIEAEAILVLPSNLKFMTADGVLKGIFMPCIMVAMDDKSINSLKNSGLGQIRLLDTPSDLRL